MVRIAIALGVAVVGGLIAGLLGWIFADIVPKGETRWAFYFIFGIPIYLILSLIFEPIGYLMNPDPDGTWPRLLRAVISILIWSLFVGVALVTSTKLKS
jgi:hypothetical protein